jgi:Transposase DNA-binding
MEANTRGFGERHFGVAKLGDERLTKRLVQIANRMVEHPGGTLPEKMESPAELEGLYRFANNSKVRHQKILEPHRQHTWQQIGSEQRTVYVIYDTTELDFSGLQSNPDLGPIGGGYNQGFLCHNGLAIYADTRECIGLVSQVLALRPVAKKNQTREESRQRADRESRLWIKGVQQAGAAPPGCKVIDVADRGADTFEFLDYEVTNDRWVLVRSVHNRRCFRGHNDTGEEIWLHEAVREQAAKVKRSIAIGAKTGRPARTAQTSITWLEVQLRAPRQARGDHGKDPLRMWAIRVWEENPPEGRQGVEWLLLTNDPVHDAASACEKVAGYESRWVIEEYHKGMKTGMRIEAMQFATGAALEAMIAIQSVVAVWLLQMRDLGRIAGGQDRPARTYVPAGWIRLLSLWRYKEERELTVREFLLALGRMGGHQNRKQDGLPGWQTLWKGMLHLQAMLEGAACIDAQKCDES